MNKTPYIKFLRNLKNYFRHEPYKFKWLLHRKVFRFQYEGIILRQGWCDSSIADWAALAYHCHS